MNFTARLLTPHLGLILWQIYPFQKGISDNLDDSSLKYKDKG